MKIYNYKHNLNIYLRTLYDLCNQFKLEDGKMRLLTKLKLIKEELIEHIDYSIKNNQYLLDMYQAYLNKDTEILNNYAYTDNSDINLRINYIFALNEAGLMYILNDKETKWITIFNYFKVPKIFYLVFMTKKAIRTNYKFKQLLNIIKETTDYDLVVNDYGVTISKLAFDGFIYFQLLNTDLYKTKSLFTDLANYSPLIKLLEFGYGIK